MNFTQDWVCYGQIDYNKATNKRKTGLIVSLTCVSHEFFFSLTCITVFTWHLYLACQ